MPTNATPMTCPYCGVHSGFEPEQSWDGRYRIAGSWVVTHLGVWRCMSCGRNIVGQRDNGGDPVEYEPQAVQRPEYNDVPENIARDATEAHVCNSVQAYRAAVAMARRALQATAQAKGAPDKRLVEQVDWMADQGILTGHMKDVGHRIRLGGNLGAHPDKDGLLDVTAQDAQAILAFMEDVLHFVYEVPARLERTAPRDSSVEEA